jgi:predicted AlkP superfamily phosphohydrolase/phosphomutase
VLTDVWCEPVAKFINVNNFLADIGLLEVNSPRSRATIDWAETLAYFMGNGQVWINLSGREPQGSVVPGHEYRQVCQAIQKELSNWKDPDTGEAILKEVLRREDAYSGEYLFKAPDLIVEYQPGYAASPQAMVLDFDTVAMYAMGTAGTSRAPHARLIASGPNLVSGHKERARTVDVMPNVMYLLGQPVPRHVDGTVIPTLFTPLHRQHHPRERIEDDGANLTREEEGYVEDRLRALGYLE